MLKKRGKSFFCLVICLIICCAFVGCGPDLGDIKDIDDYESKFSAVKFVQSSLETLEKHVSDLYNKEAVNDFNRTDFKSPVDSDAYKYMAVFAGKDVSVEEFAIYLRSDRDVTFCVYVYMKDKLPETIATGGESDYETYKEEGSDEEKTRLRTFDEPQKSEAIASVRVSLKAGEWKSFGVRDWTDGGVKRASVALAKDKCMLFQFENNCVTYSDGAIVENEFPSASVSFTSMLIRVG